MYRYNRNADRRDEILYGKVNIDRKGDIAEFTGLTFGKLSQLIEENFAHKTAKHNNAPSIGQIFKLMEKYPNMIAASGYIIYPERSDYRLVIDRLYTTGRVSQSCAGELRKIGHNADTFSEIGEIIRMWWD